MLNRKNRRDTYNHTTLKMPNHKNRRDTYNPSMSTKKKTVKNAYGCLRKILREFNVPVVKKTFGNKIVRVCCRTIAQLENISRMMKELLLSDLIQEVGMPLEYTYKMKTLVIFIKPVNVVSRMKLTYVFEECSLKYNNVAIDVESPTIAAKEIFKEEASSMKNLNLMKNSPEHFQEKTSSILKNLNLIKTSQKKQYNKSNKILIINVFFMIIHIVILIQILTLIGKNIPGAN